MSLGSEKLASIEADLNLLNQMTNKPDEFLSDYFKSLTKQIETEFVNYVRLQTETYNSCLQSRDNVVEFSKEDLDLDIEQTVLFKQSMIGEVCNKTVGLTEFTVGLTGFTESKSSYITITFLDSIL